MAIPEAEPVTVPVLLTVAVTVRPLLHTPPVVASVNGVVPPIQITGTPDMDAGEEVTVTVLVTVHPEPKE